MCELLLLLMAFLLTVLSLLALLHDRVPSFRLVNLHGDLSISTVYKGFASLEDVSKFFKHNETL